MPGNRMRNHAIGCLSLILRISRNVRKVDRGRRCSLCRHKQRASLHIDCPSAVRVFFGRCEIVFFLLSNCGGFLDVPFRGSLLLLARHILGLSVTCYDSSRATKSSDLRSPGGRARSRRRSSRNAAASFSRFAAIAATARPLAT